MKRTSVLAVILIVPVLLSLSTGQDKSSAWTLKNQYTVKVLEVHDGHTVRIQFRNGIKDNVRLLGIEAPDPTSAKTEPEEFGYPDTDQAKQNLAQWGTEAKSWIRKQIDQGDLVRIRFDEQSDHRGPYNRLLAYVHGEEMNVNRALLRAGLARVYREGEFSEKNEFIQVEQKAKSSSKRIWSRENLSFDGSQDTSDAIRDLKRDKIDCSQDVYDCSDFETYKQALRVYKQCGGVLKNVHNLDEDLDGEPCDSLK